MADSRRSFIVFGYKRSIENKYEGMVIPKEVSILILLYYSFRDNWNLDLMSDDFILTDNNTTIHHHGACRIGRVYLGEWRTVYGEQICFEHQYEWALKITKIAPDSGKNNSWKTMLGIVEVLPIEDRFVGCWNRPPPDGYGFIGSKAFLNGGNKAYGEKFEKEGDEITMYLDMDKKTLSYKINGTHYGKAFDVNEGPYRMAFSVCDGIHVVLS